MHLTCRNLQRRGFVQGNLGHVPLLSPQHQERQTNLHYHASRSQLLELLPSLANARSAYDVA